MHQAVILDLHVARFLTIRMDSGMTAASVMLNSNVLAEMVKKLWHVKIKDGGRWPSSILVLHDLWPLRWIPLGYGFHPVKVERHCSNGSKVMNDV